jgi:HEAT repeat protein
MDKKIWWAASLIVVQTYAHAAHLPTKAYYGLIQSELKNRKTVHFEELIKSWENQYGTAAVPALLKIAADKKQEDPDRYIALLGATKLGGKATAPLLSPYLKDSSWMIRTGALRALVVLNSEKQNALALPLIKDKALVVRAEAIEALKVLKPEGTEKALIESLKNPMNYHAGKATWVPGKALTTLLELDAKKYVHELATALNKIPNKLVQLKALIVLEKLTGEKKGRDLPHEERIKAWQNKT